MIKPSILEPGESATVLGRVFGTPVVVKGWTWLPLVEILVAGILTWLAGRRRPGLSLWQRIKLAALTTPIVVGSEWGHNFAHAAAARLTGRPMDAMRITWGTPLCIYFDLEDPEVTPRVHILRALGGPVFNALLLPLALAFQRFSRQGSTAHELADAAVATNTFLCTVALLPIPWIDGGPILKWSLVAGGRTVNEADRIVRKANMPLAGALGFLSALALRRRRGLLGTLLGMIAATSLGIALGWLREK